MLDRKDQVPVITFACSHSVIMSSHSLWVVSVLRQWNLNECEVD
jgi:hypothetical protein